MFMGNRRKIMVIIGSLGWKPGLIGIPPTLGHPNDVMLNLLSKRFFFCRRRKEICLSLSLCM